MGVPNITTSVPVFPTIVDDKNWIVGDDDNVPNAEITALATMTGVLGDVQGKSTDFLDAMQNLFQPTMIPVYKDTVTITMNAGRVPCQSADATKRVFRKNTSNVDITASNLDAGGPNFAASTQYYIYAIADAVSTTVTFKISTNATTPAGATIFRLIGTMLTDASGYVGTILPVSLINQGFRKVQSGTVTAQSSFTISNLCPGCKYKLVFRMNQNTSNGTLTMRFNSDSGSNYRWSNSSATYHSNSATAIQMSVGDANVGEFHGEMTLQPGVANNNIALTTWSLLEYYSSNETDVHGGGYYSGAAGITSMSMITSAGTMTGAWELYQIL